MEFLKHNHIYILGLSLLALVSTYFYFDCPPSFDESHAWNIARYLSPQQIFEISRLEGHPFLGYYLLMPFAKTDFFYPYSLYALNLILFLFAFFIFYKFAPFPNYLKYLITLSAPFLQLYSNFARNYTLTILFLFSLLALYPQRSKRQILYLSLILLLANTNILGIFMAAPLGCFLLYENIKETKEKMSAPLVLTICFGLLEVFLLYIQFHDYDTNISLTSNSFYEEMNKSIAPLNVPVFVALILTAAYLQFKQKTYFSLIFLIFTCLAQAYLHLNIYLGATHHYYFFYIYLLASYWLSLTQTNTSRPTLYLLPLTVISSVLIFNTQALYKTNYLCSYYKNLKNSAQQINKLYENTQQDILMFTLDANIMLPYLSQNINLLNQKITNYKDIESFKDYLIQFYAPVYPEVVAQHIKKSPQTLLLRDCGEKNYYPPNGITLTRKYYLNNVYCLYEIKLN